MSGDALTRINALHALGKTAAAQRIVINAIKAAGGSKRGAAAELGCSPVSLYRAITNLNMWSTLDDLAAAEGWRHRAGQARNVITLLACACVVGTSLTACSADGATAEDMAGNAPYSADVAGAPAPVTQPVTAGAPAYEVAGAPAPEPTTTPEPTPAAGAPAPQPEPQPTPEPTPEPTTAAGAPAPAPAAATSCKLTTNQVVDCSEQSRRIWVNTQLFWSNSTESVFVIGAPGYNCGATDAPACVAGTVCGQLNVNTQVMTMGVCQ